MKQKQQQRQQIAFKYKRQLKRKATKPEKKVKKLLKNLGINFKFQWVFFGKKRFVIADFYLPDFEVVLEIDGESHLTEGAIIYDKYRTKFLINRCGISEVIRFSNAVVLKDIHTVQQELVSRFMGLENDYCSQKFRETIRNS